METAHSLIYNPVTSMCISFFSDWGHNSRGAGVTIASVATTSQLIFLDLNFMYISFKE